MDKGFFYNVKNLTIRPREVILGYLAGKRKNIFNPISYLIVSVTIYLILDSLCGIQHEGRDESEITKTYEIGVQAGKFIHAYFKYFWIISVIWLSASTKLIFGRYNFAEHLVISSFIFGHATLFSLISFTYAENRLLFNPVIYLIIISLLYQVFKRPNKKWESIFAAFTATLFFILLILFMIISIVVVVYKFL